MSNCSSWLAQLAMISWLIVVALSLNRLLDVYTPCLQSTAPCLHVEFVVLLTLISRYKVFTVVLGIHFKLQSLCIGPILLFFFTTCYMCIRKNTNKYFKHIIRNQQVQYRHVIAVHVCTVYSKSFKIKSISEFI